MKNNPTVSVVIPAYNGASFISEAVQSVLEQTLPPLEIIVVDDGSQDDTVAIIEELARQHPQIQLIQQPNAGVAAARNTGLRQATGHYFALLDQDDRWLPNYLARMLAAAPPDQIVAANYQQINAAGQVVGAYRRVRASESRLPNILISTNIFLSGCIFQREVWERVGPFDDTLTGAGAEDWDWLARCVLAGYNIRRVARPLWQYRVHSTNNTRNFKMMADNTWQVLGKLFDRPELNPKLKAYRPYAFYLNYVITAGKFYAATDLIETSRYLTLARQASETDFFSIQTFISFLKIYAQTSSHNLITSGPLALDFIAQYCSTAPQANFFTGMGQLSLALLTARRPTYSIGLLVKAFRKSPFLLIQPGVYKVLARYLYLYVLEG